MQNVPNPTTVWQWTMRFLWYVIATTIVVLLVATISPRFLQVDAIWQFFALGVSVGVPIAAMHLVVSEVPTLQPYRTAMILAGMLLGAVVVSLIAGLAIPGINLSMAGLILLAIAGTALGYLVYLILDAPEPPSK